MDKAFKKFQNLPDFVKMPFVFLFFTGLTIFLALTLDQEKMKQKEE